MQITQSEGAVTATDSPGMHWLLGGFLAAIGALFVAGTLGLAHNAHQQPAGVRAFAGLAGVAGVALGVGVIRNAPRVVTEFDTVRGEVRCRRGRTAAEPFPLADVTAIELCESKDGDGDPVFRAAVRRRGGELVLLSEAWQQYGVPEAARELAALLGVPGPAAKVGR